MPDLTINPSASSTAKSRPTNRRTTSAPVQHKSRQNHPNPSTSQNRPTEGHPRNHPYYQYISALDDRALLPKYKETRRHIHQLNQSLIASSAQHQQANTRLLESPDYIQKLHTLGHLKGMVGLLIAEGNRRLSGDQSSFHNNIHEWLADLDTPHKAERPTEAGEAPKKESPKS